MRTRSRVIVAVLAAMSLAGASSAQAATEVGNDCEVTSGVPNYTFVQLARASSSPLPLDVPSAGVVTKWTVRSKVPVVAPLSFQVLRPTGNPGEFTTVAESSEATVTLGVNTFETRIPVQAGDRFGTYGGPTTPNLYCGSENPGDEIGVITGRAAVGSTNVFLPQKPYLVPVSGTVEPDADGDGYGDETQDKCPQSAAVQGECPVISLSSFGLARKGSALVLIAASSEAPVTVSGKVSYRKKAARKKGKRARTSAQLKLGGGTKTVAPG
ncbi:MAG TPA: hypothetical protein VFZ41_04055, partial [Solirubrobacterales bacterium]